jgi:hypothetical protein
MKGQDKYITGGKIDQRTDIKIQGKIADHRQQVTAKGKKNELVETDNLLSLGGCIGLVKTGIYNILVYRP